MHVIHRSPMNKVVCMTARILGLLLFIGGVALIVGGYVASQSASESVRSFLGMKFGKETMWYLIGGAAAAISGLRLITSTRS